MIKYYCHAEQITRALCIHKAAAVSTNEFCGQSALHDRTHVLAVPRDNGSNHGGRFVMGCVYLATCKVNGKQYVGVTSRNLQTRIKDHLKSSTGSKTNSAFVNAIRRYGIDEFVWSILFESDNEILLLEKESAYIVELQTLVPAGYNVVIGSPGHKGISFTEEHNKHLSAALKGKSHGPHTEEHKRKLSEALLGNQRWLGKKHKEESKYKIGNGTRGKKRGPMSEEHKKAIAAPQKGVPRGPMSDETKRKLSTAKTGTKMPDETKHKISTTLKGKKKPVERNEDNDK